MMQGNSVDAVKPQRPASVLFSFIAAWVAGGSFIDTTSQQIGVHTSVVEKNWLQSTVLTGVVVVIAAVVFFCGYGAGRLVLALAFVLDMAWPMVWNQWWQSTHHYGVITSSDMDILARIKPGIAGLIIVIFMYAMPPIRQWLSM